MRLEIIGSGEAYDSQRVNASVMIAEAGYRLLIDCGPTVPQALWRRRLPPGHIDAIYFSHIHPDHASGLTSLLNQWGSVGRQKPLQIICHPKQQPHLAWLADYAAWPAQLPFPISWLDASQLAQLGHWQLGTAPTRHSISNLALRLDSPAGGSLFYSGDGRPTPASRDLMSGAVLAMQECFSSQPESPSSGHGDLPDCLRLQAIAKPQQLLLYHIAEGQHQTISNALQQRPDIAVAEDNQHWCCVTGRQLNQSGEPYATVSS